tara:strand:+ start:327 stop:602 length:276 start_codon:yes stop_codon:yes gene_type:complete
MKFPFNEGDDYFTIEYLNFGVHADIIQSCWDDQSEEIHTDDSVYFATVEDALNSLASEGIEFVKYYNFTDLKPSKLYLNADTGKYDTPLNF